MKDQLLVVSGLVVCVFVFFGSVALFGGGIGSVVTAVVIGTFLLFETLSNGEHNKKIDEHNKKYADTHRQLCEERALRYDAMVNQGMTVNYDDKPWKKGCRIDPATGAMIEPGV
jgi:hypothetical protein